MLDPYQYHIIHCKTASISISRLTIIHHMEKRQLVLVPNPGITHLPSIIHFAKLLVNYDDRLSITALIIKTPTDDDSAAHTFIHSLASSPSFPKRLHLLLLPTHHSILSHNFDQVSSFLEAVVQAHKPQVREAVSNLNSDPASPRLAGFIVDMFSTAMIDVADEFGVPSMVFFTSGAAYLGVTLHLHTLRERDRFDTTSSEFMKAGNELAIPSFVNPVPVSVLPLFFMVKDWEGFFLRYAGGLKRAKGIIVNTFEELESHALRSYSNGGISVYPVGPILGRKADYDTSVQQKSDIIEWLDNQPASSVIFLCFGSRGSLGIDQVREIACALEKSGVRFLWSLRKPQPKGSIEQPREYSNFEEILPDGFLERTAGIGRVIGWAPQTQILAHRATGGFVSHCGWSSVLESIYYGVPIATWPLYAEQQANAFQLVRELKMAVEISLDFNVKSNMGTTFLSAEKIERGIREVMKEGSEVRKKVKEMSQICHKALMEGGSSYSYLGRLIHDITKMA